MKMLKLLENTQGDWFIHLLDCCFSSSEYFTLTRFGGHSAPTPPDDPTQAKQFRAAFIQHDAVLSALSECRVGTIESTHWFRTWTESPMYIDLYQATEEAKNILCTFYDNLFLRSSARGIILPADICFFQKGVCWFASCSHEGICYAYPQNQATASELKQCGVWTPVERDTCFWRIALSDYEIIG